MKNKPSALLVVLLLLIAVIGIWIGNTPNAENQAPAAKSRADLERAATDAQEENREARARRLSPPAWVPPTVFAGKATPVPQISFPRGENASRRYHTPKTADLAPNLNSLPPSILANSPEDGRFHLLPDEIDLHTRLARRMVFVPAALDSIIQGNTSRLLAPTVGQEVLTLEFKTVKSRNANTHTFNGHVVGEESTSDVQLVYHDGVIQGNVARYTRGQEIEYRIMADGHMMVRELDQSTMNAPCGNGTKTEAEAMIENLSEQGITVTPETESSTVEGDTVGWRHVDVVVGYDKAARIAQGGYPQIEALIIASVDRMTTSFANSLVSNTELILLGTIEDPDYVFPGGTSDVMGSGDELGNLSSSSDGILDTVSNYATQLGADLQSFIIKQSDGSAGIAHRPGRSSVVARTYMTSTRITFAHELGHNLGCDHSWGDSSQAYHSNYGWRLDADGSSSTTNDRVRTIMAYDWDWGAGARIPYFSNPVVNYNGTPTGAVNGHNVQTDTRGDQRYYQGGLGYTGSNASLSGFNGLNATLGANNSNTIDTGAGVDSYGATYASTRVTRTSFNVTSPSTGVEWARDTTQTIFFTGGDEDDLATLQLYKGGVFQADLATNRNAATGRSFPWTIPASQASGTDYMIRVSLNRNSSTITADSGTFSIIALTPMVISQTPASAPTVSTPVSQLVLTFNTAMNPASFTVADDVISFTGPGATDLKPSITSGVWSSGNTVLTLNFPSQSASGSYQLVLGSQIQGSTGTFLDQDQDNNPGESTQDRYAASFSILTLADALDTTELTWTTSGNLPWFSQTATKNDGVDAAQSGAIGFSQVSAMETTVTGPGTLTFWWKVSSENNYDWLRFYMDGVEQTGSLTKISGEVEWVQKTVSILAGSHVVKWSYETDYGIASGSDAAWVDQVVFTPPAAPEIAVEQPVGTGLTDGSSIINFGSINTGSSSSAFTFTIRNTGTDNLTGLALSKTGTHSADYALGSPGATTLAPGDSTTFNVTFTPGAAGTRAAAIQIVSNDANENPFDINLTGTGVGPGTLTVTPAGGLTSSGNYGGAFSPSSIEYTLSNPGGTSINWTAAHTQSWVTLNATSGTLDAGASTTVMVSINSGSNTLNATDHSDTVSFTSSTTGSTTRGVYLTVNPQPVTVSLSNLAQTYDTFSKPVTVTTTPPGIAHSVTYNSSATVPIDVGTYAVVATVTQANYTGSSTGNLTINKASQTITFGALSPVLDNAAPFVLGATANSGLTVSYASSNTNVATVSGNTVNIIGLGSTTITASQAGNANYNAATSVPQTLTVERSNPLAVTGGPYKVLVGQSLSLDGSASFPSYLEAITAYSWDLNNDGTFGDATGATPSALAFSALMNTWGMAQGLNTIQLRITDSSSKVSTVSSTVELVLDLLWDANGATSGQTNGVGAWLDASKWWDGVANQTWATGSNSTFGGPSTAGGAVTLAGPTSVNAITFNTFTGTYTLGTAGQTLTINGGINKTATSGAVTISSPIVLGAAQTWTNNSNGTSLSTGVQSAGVPVDNGGNLLTIDGGGATYLKWGSISGDGGLTKNGTGFLEIGGQNSAVSHTYTGTTTLNGGVLRINNEFGGGFGNLGSGNLTLNGGVLEYYYGGAFTRTLGAGVGQVQILGGASGFGCGNSVTFTLNNSSAYEVVWDSTYFNPSAFVLNAVTSAGTTTLANKIDLNGATRTIEARAGTARITGVIRTSNGTAGIIKMGNGILALEAANTYNGDTTISGGTLRIGNNTAGTLGGGNYAGNISIANGATLQIWSTAAQALSGAIGGEGGLNKAYGGALTLSGPNTYSGRSSFLPQTNAGFTVNVSSFNSVNGGTPLLAYSSLGAPSTIANGTIDIGSSAKQAGVILNYTGPGETTDRVINFGFNGTASQTISASGSGLLKFTSAMTSNATSQTGQLILSGTGNGEITQALPALPTGGLTKSGTGSWTLGGANSYTGPTAITAGKLTLNGDQSLATGNVSVSASATLGGTGTIGGNTTVAANGRLEFNLSTEAGSHDKLELAATRALTFSGASVLTITSSGGASPGTYTLLTAPGGITGVAPATLNLPASWSASVSIVDNDLVLNVTSTGATYTVSYDANSATSGTVPADQTKNEGVSLALAFNTGTLARTGYSFAGWNTLLNGTGTDYAEGANYTTNAALTLYAKWTMLPYTSWAAGTFANAFTDTAATSNPDGDSLTNLQEFAFGMDPTSPRLAPLSYVADVSTTAGTPILEKPGSTYRAVFARRKDHIAAGLTYAVEFSANLTHWKASQDGLSVVSGTSPSDVDAVAVPFPPTVPLTAAETDHAPPKFFRVAVTGN